jgi:hypothetical protein
MADHLFPIFVKLDNNDKCQQLNTQVRDYVKGGNWHSQHLPSTYNNIANCHEFVAYVDAFNREPTHNCIIVKDSSRGVNHIEGTTNAFTNVKIYTISHRNKGIIETFADMFPKM